MTDTQINRAVEETLDWGYPSGAWWTTDCPDNVRDVISKRYADDPMKQGEFLKHLRATRADMTTFDLLTLDARAWSVAFLKTEGKWKEG